MYIAPIRTDVPPPYYEEEYLLFKQDVKHLAGRMAITVHDLDSIVPQNHWGYMESINLDENIEIDFMHFQYGGHLILANRIYDILITEGFIVRLSRV